MPATVIADVFSGVPNPQWTVAGDLLVQLKLMLAQLSHYSGAVPDLPGLGYRGLIVHLSGGDGGGDALRIFDGVIVGPHGMWADHGRMLERWLLETGVESTKADILKELLAGFR